MLGIQPSTHAMSHHDDASNTAAGSQHSRNASAESFEEIFAATTTTGFSLSCWSATATPATSYATICHNPFAPSLPTPNTGFSRGSSNHSCGWDEEGDSDEDSGDSDGDSDGGGFSNGDSDGDDEDEDDNDADEHGTSDNETQAPPATSQNPQQRSRRVSFHPTQLVEVHSIERIDLQDYAHVYYCVHELQKMIEEVKLEESQNNDAPVPI